MQRPSRWVHFLRDLEKKKKGNEESLADQEKSAEEAGRGERSTGRDTVEASFFSFQPDEDVAQALKNDRPSPLAKAIYDVYEDKEQTNEERVKARFGDQRPDLASFFQGAGRYSAATDLSGILTDDDEWPEGEDEKVQHDQGEEEDMTASLARLTVSEADTVDTEVQGVDKGKGLDLSPLRDEDTDVALCDTQIDMSESPKQDGTTGSASKRKKKKKQKKRKKSKAPPSASGLSTMTSDAPAFDFAMSADDQLAREQQSTQRLDPSSCDCPSCLVQSVFNEMSEIVLDQLSAEPGRLEDLCAVARRTRVTPEDFPLMIRFSKLGESLALGTAESPEAVVDQFKDLTQELSVHGRATVFLVLKDWSLDCEALGRTTTDRELTRDEDDEGHPSTTKDPRTGSVSSPEQNEYNWDTVKGLLEGGVGRDFEQSDLPHVERYLRLRLHDDDDPTITTLAERSRATNEAYKAMTEKAQRRVLRLSAIMMSRSEEKKAVSMSAQGARDDERVYDEPAIRGLLDGAGFSFSDSDLRTIAKGLKLEKERQSQDMSDAEWQSAISQTYAEMSPEGWSKMKDFMVSEAMTRSVSVSATGSSSRCRESTLSDRRERTVQLRVRDISLTAEEVWRINAVRASHLSSETKEMFLRGIIGAARERARQ